MPKRDGVPLAGQAWAILLLHMDKPKLPEPWLRGTLTDVEPVQRAVLHALELAKENLEHWCADLTPEELNARPGGVASVGFHLRHIPGSMDRLLTYAEGKSLTNEQVAAMKAEGEPAGGASAMLSGLREGIESASGRIRAFTTSSLSEPRTVGRQQMPTTVAGLLVHVADHTQRHAGQAVTTVKIIRSNRQV